jgi:hypothetical protein
MLVARWAAVFATVACIPLLLIASRADRWDDPVLLVTLGAIALLSLWALVAVKPAVFLDAEFVTVLLALAFLGPLAAVAIWISAEAVYFVLSRRPTEAHAANVASYGWAVLAGYVVLELLAGGTITEASASGAYLAHALAAVAMLVTNFAVARGIVGTVLEGQAFRSLVRGELIGPAPATLLMIAVGVATAFLYTRIGILALALFAVIVVTPQYLVPVLLRPRPVNEIPYVSAVAMYARAIGRIVGLDRAKVAMLEDASTFLDIKVFGPVQGTLRSDEFEHWTGVQETLLFYREHWDAPGGTPGALEGELIPLTSRILAVADVWSRLTAQGSPELTHLQALTVLKGRSGYHFDPGVVDAVQTLIEHEQLGTHGDSSFEPRLHRMPLPSLVAKLRAPATPLT